MSSQEHLCTFDIADLLSAYQRKDESWCNPHKQDTEAINSKDAAQPPDLQRVDDARLGNPPSTGPKPVKRTSLPDAYTQPWVPVAPRSPPSVAKCNFAREWNARQTLRSEACCFQSARNWHCVRGSV